MVWKWCVVIFRIEDLIIILHITYGYLFDVSLDLVDYIRHEIKYDKLVNNYTDHPCEW